jgi:hypothetical protein
MQQASGKVTAELARGTMVIWQVAGIQGGFQVSICAVDSRLSSTYTAREQAWILLNY